MFYSTARFKFAQHLESNWYLIKEELRQLQKANFMPWPEKFLYKKGWDVFGLYAFGKKQDKNCELCPETTKLVEYIPGLTTAGFSSLEAGTHIVPHVGYSKEVLRGHLGLFIPENCAIRVGSETRQWEEGKCMIFDDTFEHEAWNHSSLTRIVLLFDFQKSYVKEAIESEKITMV
ncbi:MAG: aspartyl/asparaginyl beta-hydroxylase domain-containing protein [Cyanobacteria bacterium J06633_8]